MKWHRKPEGRLLIYMGVIALLAIAGTVAIFLVAFPALTGFAVQEKTASNSELPESIKIGTFAVCGEKEGYTFCEDKMFASCNKSPVEVKNGIFECNSQVYDVGKSKLGSTYLAQGWVDTRPSNMITAWAASE